MIKLSKIENKEQYNEYCDRLIDLLESNLIPNENELTQIYQLIEEWEQINLKTSPIKPVNIIKLCMKIQKISYKQLSVLLNQKISYVKDILLEKKIMTDVEIELICNKLKISKDVLINNK